MSREYAIESSKLPLSIRGMLSQPAVRGVYLEELPDRVSDTSEISSDRYSVIEDDLMNVEGISDTSCPFTHSYAAYIYVSEAGTYRFYVRANFGAEATIYDGENGVTVRVSCGFQAESSSVEEIAFDGPGYYKVEVKYFSTGEASPVLELHFGKNEADSASREELPQLRDFYIMRNSNGSASLRGNGTEIRPGHEYPIELHNLDGYYTIYGGTVTVIHPNNTSETYPLEGSSVKIPFVPVENLTVHPFSGCTAEIIVQVSSGGGGCGCGGSGTSQTLPTFTATILPENYREDSAPKCACGCSNPTITNSKHCKRYVMKLFFRKVSKKTWIVLCIFVAFEFLAFWVYHRCTFLDWPMHVFSYQAAGTWMKGDLVDYGREHPLPDKLDSRFYYSPLTISRCCHARYQDDKPYLQYHMFPSPEGPDFRRFISSKDDEIVYTLDISVSSTAYEQRNEHFYCHGTKRGSMKQLYPEGGR